MNVAVTVLFSFIVMVHVPVPEQLPPQPVNVSLPEGVAVRVTTVPLVKVAEHVDPQLMPVGELETVPVPVPDWETAKV